MKFTVKILILPLILFSCYHSEELPPDQQVWEYDNPGDNELNEDSLLKLNDSISSGQFQVINSLIIIRNDKLVFENYYNNSERHALFSLDRASIVFTVAALGIAIDEGLLSLSTPIHEFLPSYQSFFNDAPEKKEITIEHLLTHRSGLSWNESLSVFLENPNNNLNQMTASDDWIAFILNQPLQAAPGFFFNRNSATGVILAKVIENASDRPFSDYIKSSLLDVTGITNFIVNQDPAGNFDGGRGISTTLIDWTKLGSLMIKEGIWNNRKVIDPAFVTQSVSQQASVSGTFNLGLGWWLFGTDYTNFFAISKDEIYFIPGEIGQHLYIIPSQNMVVSISAENFFFGFNNPSLNLFAQITTSIQ